MTSTTVLHAANIVVRAVLVAAIGLTVFVAYGLMNNAWYHVLVVRGGSMEPAITAGDLIVITRPPEQVGVGQVLTLQVDGAVVTHRVVEVNSDGTFVTQGDANDARDDFTANDVRVVGEYRFSIPLVGMLIEPIVSGAWFGDADAAGVTAASGFWESPATMLETDSTGRITWSAPSTSEPIPSTAPDPTADATPTTSAGPTPTETAEASPESTAGETADPSVSPVPHDDAGPVPTAGSAPTSDPTPQATPSAEPEPSATPPPTPSVEPVPSAPEESPSPTPSDSPTESQPPSAAP